MLVYYIDVVFVSLLLFCALFVILVVKFCVGDLMFEDLCSGVFCCVFVDLRCLVCGCLIDLMGRHCGLC